MINPVNLPNIRNITISGRIGSGTTTLALGLSKKLGWKLLEGGALFEKIHKEMKMSELEVGNRPDHFDIEYENKVKKMLNLENHNIIQSHLSGFDAQSILGVFKILVVCEDEKGNDKPEIRIDRLINRRGIGIEEAKKEVLVREIRNLEKWRRLYVSNDSNWVYWNKKYYDLVINTYSKNQDETLKTALQKLGHNRKSSYGTSFGL